jgi:hypothetical protein
MFVLRKKYLIRHKILETLKQYSDKFPEECHEQDICMAVSQIKQQLPYEQKQIENELDYLCYNQDVDSTKFEGSMCFYISFKGTSAYADRKYITEARKAFINNLKEIIVITSTIILMLIALINFIINIKETKQNKSDIEQLKIKVDSLKK